MRLVLFTATRGSSLFRVGVFQLLCAGVCLMCQCNQRRVLIGQNCQLVYYRGAPVGVLSCELCDTQGYLAVFSFALYLPSATMWLEAVVTVILPISASAFSTATGRLSGCLGSEVSPRVSPQGMSRYRNGWTNRPGTLRELSMSFGAGATDRYSW